MRRLACRHPELQPFLYVSRRPQYCCWCWPTSGISKGGGLEATVQALRWCGYLHRSQGSWLPSRSPFVHKAHTWYGTRVSYN